MRYAPTRASVRQHKVPEWYRDAKFGIFVHWGPFSVLAYAPLGHGDIDQLVRGPFLQVAGLAIAGLAAPAVGWPQ